ncbi:MAG: BsuBI/PstI family type II restriction endonuclease [Terriglobia bacterium]
MSKTDEALDILTSLGLPRSQQNERSVLTLLALAGIGPRTPWKNTTQPMLRIWDIMGFMRERYNKDYAANSRETIRRQTIHQLEQARIVNRNPDDPTRPTNSGKTVYQLTDEVQPLLKAYGSASFEKELKAFISRFGSLREAYRRSREGLRVPLTLPDSSVVYLSPGEHNVLQVDIVEQLGPRFAPGAVVLYVGDTALKHVVYAEAQLKKIGVPITEHDKLPDVVLHRPEKNCVYLIEAVTSHGPVSPKRHGELEKMLARCTADRVYITAFLDIHGFRKYAADIAWETEVWIADNPDHMIHFNGPKFLGPYKPKGA